MRRVSWLHGVPGRTVDRAGWTAGGLTSWLAMGAVVLVVALLTPATGDDWRRIALDDRSLSGYLGKALEHYRGHNGRLAGNTVSYVFMEPRWLRALAKAVVVLTLVAVLRRVTGGRTSWHALLCFAGVFLLPAAVFRQSQGWATGFFYYVPPMIGVLLLVGTLSLSRSRGRPLLTAVSCGAVGFLTCLFIEHVTVAMVLLTLGGLVLSLRGGGRPSAASAGWAVGVLAGAALMFASPGMSRTAAGDSDYYSSPGGAWVDTVTANYAMITRSFVLASPVLMTVLVAACLAHAAARLTRARTGRDLALVATVLLVGTYAVGRRLWLYDHLRCGDPVGRACELPLLGIDLLMTLLLLGTMVVTGLRVVPRERWPAWCWLLAATVLMLAPLLVVQPIGPRNVYGPLVTVAGMAVMLAAPLLVGRTAGADLWKAGTAAAVLVASSALLWVQWSNFQVAEERVARMERAVAERSSEVVLPDLPYPAWVHGPDDAKIGYRYYLERRNDIAITFGG